MRDEISGILPFLRPRRAAALAAAADGMPDTEEIRFRENAPIMLCRGNKSVFIKDSPLASCEVDEIFRKMIKLSYYSHSGELKNGFVTLSRGQRVGVCLSGGRAHSLCVRVPREIKGAAGKLISAYAGGGVLIAGAPGTGKTTLLRDFTDALSEGRFPLSRRNAAVVDTRGEISLCGKAPFCKSADVILFREKREGISQAIRTLSPDCVIFDEISDTELDAVREGLFAGVDIITTAHAGTREDLLKRSVTRFLLDSGAISRVALLDAEHGYSVLSVG